ncbi:putative protein mkt1 [Trypanosoma cruzi]|uniref:Uncharacterized protein n=1 Tax=Trypanosoma cruzi TaxID=5693 RepID=A0A2V2X509_TRYCR|nr:putative protein mkt1 [Trypanosoma cruzi]
MYPRQDDVSLLQRYINDNKLEEKGVPLTELRRLEGTGQVMLGVDGTKIIDLITQAVREKEKMAIYTYTTPFTVYDKITDVCKTLRSLKNCTPVLVFNGIPFYPDPSDDNCREKNMVPPDVAALNGTDSSRLCNMHSMRAVDIQKKSSSRFFVEEDVENQIVKLFRSEFKDTMRAPYLAWAQLSAFCHPKNRHISEVYGCLELLAFPGIDRVITNINVMKGTVDMVRKSRLLELLRISEDDLGSLIVVDSRNRVMRTVGPKFSSFDDMCKKITRLNDLSLGASYVHQLHQEAMHLSEQARNRTLNLKSAVLRNLAALGCPVLTLVPPYCTLLTRYMNRVGNYRLIPRWSWGVLFHLLCTTCLQLVFCHPAFSVHCVRGVWWMTGHLWILSSTVMWLKPFYHFEFKHSINSLHLCVCLILG